MLLFITSEVMFFAGLFAAYFNVRANAPQSGRRSSSRTSCTHLPFVGPATVLLILSSFTCQIGVWAIRRNDRKGLTRAIAVTVILGVDLPRDAGDRLQRAVWRGRPARRGHVRHDLLHLDGFHGAHVLGGVLMLSVVLYRSMSGQFSSRHHDMVEATSMYWHFVDVVWILLFSTLYIL